MSAAPARAGLLPARWAWALVLLWLWPGLAMAREVPALRGRVVDQARVLSSVEVRQLEQRLARYEQQTGRQLAVLTVDSLMGDPLEDFSVRVVEAWKLGREDQDDGLLVVLAMQERRVRIEVGYGLEGQITDVAAARIIHDVMRPHLRRGRAGEALSAGVDALMIAAGAAEAPPEPEAAPGFWTRRYYGHPGFWYVLVGVTLVGVFGLCLRWPLVGVFGLFLFGRLWWPGSLVCIVALYIRYRLARRRSARNGYGLERAPQPRSSGGGVGSFLWKLAGLVTLFGVGKALLSNSGRRAARRIGGGGGGGGLFGGGGGRSVGGFVGGGGSFGGGGASGGW